MEWSDLQALPSLVKAWGAVWWVLTLGMFGSVRIVLAVDSDTVASARGHASQNLWQINTFLRGKLSVMRPGSDYLTTEQELYELSGLVRECLAKDHALTGCRKYSDLAKIAAWAHGVALVVWGGLIVSTDLDSAAWGLTLFFLPAALFLVAFVTAFRMKMDLHS